MTYREYPKWVDVAGVQTLVCSPEQEAQLTAEPVAAKPVEVAPEPVVAPVEAVSEPVVATAPEVVAVAQPVADAPK